MDNMYRILENAKVAPKQASIDKLKAESKKYRGGKSWHTLVSVDCREFLHYALTMLYSGELNSLTQMYKSCTAVVESDFTEDLRLWPKITAFKAWVAEQQKNFDKQSALKAQNQPIVTKKPAKRRVSTA